MVLYRSPYLIKLKKFSVFFPRGGVFFDPRAMMVLYRSPYLIKLKKFSVFFPRGGVFFDPRAII